jgi:2-C-methyl-D-erythritol 2,4-cyclodiphosphate synthase
MRIGHGYDVHRFGPGEAVMLGGVRIAHTHGLVAHSDGDVALHALCDALLGAIAAGDIGRHFPDTDPRFRGADSRELLRACMALVLREGYRLGNADVTIIAERPRVAPHVEAMRTNIAADLGARVHQVNVKATTTEGLGFTGRREGIAAHVVVLLEPLPPEEMGA